MNLGHFKTALVVSLIVSSISFATLSQVNLISQNHIVQGYVDDPPGSQTYYETGTQPISGSCSSSYGGAQSHTEDLGVHGITAGGGMSYWAEASIAYVFYPLGNTLDFSFSQGCNWSGSPAGSWFSFYLKDLETNTSLISFTGDDDFIWAHRIDDTSGEVYEGSNQFSVSLDHRYELYLFIHADAMDGTSVDLTADIVPEPTTILLLVIGAGMIRKNYLHRIN
jgi:hypothetical protein